MEILVVVVQIVKDLLGSLNPLRLFRRDYRASFGETWKQEPRIVRIGYVLGILGLVVLLGIAALALFGGLST